MNKLEEQLEHICKLDDLGLFDQAMPAAEALARAHPQQPRALAARARQHYKQGDITQAQADVNAALALDAQCADALWMQALLDGEQDTDKCIAGLRRVLQIEPDHVLALTSLGYDLNHSGQGEEAERLLRRAIALRPDRLRPQHNLMSTLARMGRAGEDDNNLRDTFQAQALDGYLERARLMPDHPLVQFDAGTALYQLKQYERAQPYFDAALRLAGPGHNNIEHNRAMNLRDMGRWQEAIAQWDEVLAREPDWDWAVDGWIEAHYRMAYTHFEQNEWDQVHALLAPLIERPDCRNAWVWNMMGLYHARQNQWPQALQLHQRAMQLAPEQAFVHVNAIHAALALDDALLALELAQQAHAQVQEGSNGREQLQPSYQRVLDAVMNRAEQLPEQYRHAEMLALVEQLHAARHLGHISQGWLHWAQGAALVGLGRYEQARQAYEAGHAAYLAEGDEEGARLCQDRLQAIKIFESRTMRVLAALMKGWQRLRNRR